MNRTLRLAIPAAALIAGVGSASGSIRDPECLIRLSKVAHAPRFEAYPATRVRAARLAEPRVDRGEAHRFRTLLRKSREEPPNFAGHFRIVVIGCGTSCTDFAIVDTLSGRVFFLPDLRLIATLRVADAALHFERDSRLLIIEGAPRENLRREGVLFGEWTGTRFRTIRWVPRRLSCSTEAVNA
jgi:hypothetical protein